MSFISDRLNYLDAQVDRLQLERVPFSEPGSPLSADAFHSRTSACISPHAKNLQRVLKALGTTPQSTPNQRRLVSLLKEAKISKSSELSSYEQARSESHQYELELEWLLLSKAAIQTYSVVLNYLVEETLPLSEDLFYWDEVLSSYRYTALYLLQSSPRRLFDFSKEVYGDAMRKLQELKEQERIPFQKAGRRGGEEERKLEKQKTIGNKQASLSETLSKFYALVRNSIYDRKLAMGGISPFSLARHEIRKKQASVRKLREMKASALGVLIGEGLSFEFEEDHDEWKAMVERAVLLMENVVRNVSSVDHSLDEFEETVFSLERVGEVPEELMTGSGTLRISTSNTDSGAGGGRAATAALSSQLQEILVHHLPAQSITSKTLISTHGRPGLITRYWFPATALLLSSTTLLRFFTLRKAALKTWVQELGATMIDFWMNWVIEPVRKIVGTIRHSSDSEVALMSRRSLTADMESLERMVVDFAVDNPATSSSAIITAAGPSHIPPSSSLSEEQIAQLRMSVKEGDLTPVLRAYECDLRRPFLGAVRGELVRALLIQIQKTKVDVEVAISGIDKLLKSQELVFGFVGLTPGILVCVGGFRWLNSFLGKGRGRKNGKRSEQLVRVLRNIDRILAGSRANSGENNGLLSYKEHGLLMCEIHVFRELGGSVVSKNVLVEFVVDMEELVDVRRGVARQRAVLERIRWAYAKWMK